MVPVEKLDLKPYNFKSLNYVILKVMVVISDVLPDFGYFGTIYTFIYLTTMACFVTGFFEYC